MEKRKVPVEKEVLLARIRRKLKQTNQKLHVSKSRKELEEFGECYATEGSGVVWSHKTFEDLGRKLNCLKEYECLTEGKKRENRI